MAGHKYADREYNSRACTGSQIFLPDTVHGYWEAQSFQVANFQTPVDNTKKVRVTNFHTVPKHRPITQIDLYVVDYYIK